VVFSASLACNINLNLPFPNEPTPMPPVEEPDELLPETLVTFRVQVPTGSLPQEQVLLTLLDEVTGLPHNTIQHTMEAGDDGTYSITIPLTVGSTVKYRYAHTGTYTAYEHTSDQRPVRYRVYLVETPGILQDVVSAWSDTIFNAPSGRIAGQATDDQTGAPVRDLLVTAGGKQTYSAADGSFLLEGLPVGTHNLVAYAMDGSYQTFQQGAVVAEESTTPAPLSMTGVKMVDIVFSVTVPQDTMPAVPLRLAGNLSQLGNTFAELPGGVNALAARIPALTPAEDGRYNLTISLPVGAYIRYKYTLGDGFWNAEQDLQRNFRLRHFIVPETRTVIEDTVLSWSGGTSNSILFELTVPDYTPSTDHISIQFNPFGWMEPIPMWPLGDNRWVFILYGPLNVVEKFGYRYCRNDQCNSADDSSTPGNDSFGRIAEVKDELQVIKDQVESWSWLSPEPVTVTIATPPVRQRMAGFLAGVEFQSYYHPSWLVHLPATLREIHAMGVNWVVLDPTWTFSRQIPPVLEQVSGRDMLTPDLIEMIRTVKSSGLHIALNPTASFLVDEQEWWASAPRDFAWWQTWFERYRTFTMHHATIAELEGVEALILGGDWLTTAVPNAQDGEESAAGQPVGAEQRWRELIAEVRQTYSGTLIWALPFPAGIENPPAFLGDFDQLYLLWSPALADEPDKTEAELHMRAADLLDEIVKPFQAEVGIPLTLGIYYPSAEGSSTGCLPDPLVIDGRACLNIDYLTQPNPDIPTIQLGLEEQAWIYNAMLVAINERDWVSGFISRGYYPPASLADKSPSIHGKPAADVLSFWFPQLLGSSAP
jgi:hypothetical protein